MEFPRVRLVEPLVGRIERGNGKVQQAHPADGSMPAAGSDIDGGEWLERMADAVEFDFALAIEHDIDLGHDLVIMRAGVFGDIDQVNTGGVVRVVCEGPACGAAGTTVGRQLIQLDDCWVVHAWAKR